MSKSVLSSARVMASPQDAYWAAPAQSRSLRRWEIRAQSRFGPTGPNTAATRSEAAKPPSVHSMLPKRPSENRQVIEEKPWKKWNGLIFKNAALRWWWWLIANTVR